MSFIANPCSPFSGFVLICFILRCLSIVLAVIAWFFVYDQLACHVIKLTLPLFEVPRAYAFTDACVVRAK